MNIVPIDQRCPTSVSDHQQPEEHGVYIIYCIRNRTNILPYVGLTKRSLESRVSAHITQARRQRRVRPGGLLQAIRDAHAEGKSFAEAFTATVLDTAPDVEQARELEQSWIARLNALQPFGYNLMPGGASVGGPANSRSITVSLPGVGRRTWDSIGSAIVACNGARRSRGLAPLLAASIYARLQSGWSADQALGLAPRQDRRSLRVAPVIVDGHAYSSLREASAATGITADALRSRLHRAGRQPTADIAVDRRRMRCGPSSRIAITWPATGEQLTVRGFAARTGVPVATVLRRWHQANHKSPKAMDPKTLCSWLQTHQERRKVIRLVLSDGTTWEGGYRELTRRLLAHPRWEAQRTSRLDESGIRRRLRRQCEAHRADPGRIRWAFGFDEE